MKRKLLISLSAVLLMFNLSAKAQYILHEADEQYRLYNYIKAIDLYEQAYKKKNTLHAAERLAEGYNLTKNYVQAQSWYATVAGMPTSTPKHVLGYAQTLISNSKYTEAKQQLQRYINLKGDVSQRQKDLWLQSCDSALKWMQNPMAIQIQNAKELNSAKSDWGAVKINSNTIFTSDREDYIKDHTKSEKPFLKFGIGKMPDQHVYGWTGNQYLRLYQKVGNDSVQLFPFNAGTAYHIGVSSFTADGKEMYFTLTRIPQNLDYSKDKLATVNVEIYSSKKAADGNTWETPVALKFNNVNTYSVGDPFISKDGKTLYFVSDKPGGKGGTDIYTTTKNTTGEWATPLNLAAINTENNERSPFLDEAAILFFSSDGYPGMGGLDIFKSTIKEYIINKPVNLGYPINSPQDDFAYNMNSAKTGYFSSNRTGGLGSDDIYNFTLPTIPVVLPEVFKLEGKIFNKKTGQPLAAATATLKTKDGSVLKVQTDDSGYYSFKIDQDISYRVSAKKVKFLYADTNFRTKKSLIKDFYLTPIEINKAIRLENIYYDFNKWNIRTDAGFELDKLVKILIDNPTIWIELGSHTDSRGNDAYNLALSQKRADAAVKYIISKGIVKNRVISRGYGETQLINKCNDGVKCSNEEHQLNRRTEFKIIKEY
ncbi:flagellar motor protein MotB [Pedobacter polaris]|uniref:Flagellar motor protein MotB n=1 Tax=Pedobacter polaris TaxID=2571273 RepID=A0A4U1CTL2_9SPHI|nr:OmpA family protein [Pedobacter polaris]TKC10430.1 flagellar motor protein MotB [Pedobacter polaris]